LVQVLVKTLAEIIRYSQLLLLLAAADKELQVVRVAVVVELLVVPTGLPELVPLLQFKEIMVVMVLQEILDTQEAVVLLVLLATMPPVAIQAMAVLDCQTALLARL
jgi:hypothetical protein